MVSRELVDFLWEDDTWSGRHVDLLTQAPDLTFREAYELQMALTQRRVEHGDRLVGYKASGTARRAASLMPGMPWPVMGTVLASHLAFDGDTYELRPGATWIEAEIAVVMGRDLSGEHVGPVEAAQAIEALCPAIDIAAWSPTTVAKERSEHHAIATNKTGGLIVLGAPHSPKIIDDLRLEAAIVELDGEAMTSGAGAEVMGHPYRVVAAVARHLAGLGTGLKAGDIISTGSMAQPLQAQPGHKSVKITFTHLGSVGITFTLPAEDSK